MAYKTYIPVTEHGLDENGKETWGRRRDIKKSPPFTLAYLIEICSRALIVRDSCLLALLFLSGRRINEVLGLRKKDLIVSDEDLGFYTFNEKTFRSRSSGDYTWFIGGKWTEVKRTSKVVDGINVVEEQRIEHDGHFYEKIYVSFPIRGVSGEGLFPFIKKHLDTLVENDYLFYDTRCENSPTPNRTRSHISANMAWRIVTRLEPRIWLHWMRHKRFTQIARLYKKEPRKMHTFTKHKHFETTLGYIDEVENLEELKEI